MNKTNKVVGQYHSELIFISSDYRKDITELQFNLVHTKNTDGHTLSDSFF